MQAIDFKDKKTIYALVVSLLILAGAYFVYTYMWEPFTLEEQRLESELRQAEAELSKINVQKGRIAKLEAELVAAENEFERLKEMFPEEEKVPMRLQDLYAVLRSAGVQIQKFSPGPRSEREYFFEHRYSVAVNAGYHMLGYLFAEIANFNYPTAITDLKISRYSGIKQEIEKAESHGWTPITISVSFNLTTYTSKKVAQ
ncbi:MAG: type 4a pilus biogenesis protein PilO [Hallerella sp.]|jgi:type IV pilus assembly protein PilO|nr:type 4a pilus biogenesis protein PilO [Fibrobacter sp.]MDY6368745.1 type 4a pilus biogenesis protein PilO [Fibrobacter sp.]MDY6389235.1 type 4a pilus biogenesis protein PilO [Fibrobacter sp.]MEE3339260.1 type 4a pilus biogenesis protein PilO [Hallerella sp.]